MRTKLAVPRLRSVLFVPGHRDDFLDGVDRFGADGIILDLEDGVSSNSKTEACQVVERWLELRAGHDSPIACARINPIGSGSLDRDLSSVVRESLTAVVLPKVRSAVDVAVLADALSYYEGRYAIPHGTVRIWPLIESADAVRQAYEIARASPRVAYMGGGAAERGDLASSLGYKWTPEGLETLYVQSKVLIDVRAANVTNPVTGLVTRLTDLDQISSFARRARELGYEGMMVIHPSHVAVVNEAFTPTEQETVEAQGIAKALAAADERGDGASVFNDQMVDIAMRQTVDDGSYMPDPFIRDVAGSNPGSPDTIGGTQ